MSITMASTYHNPNDLNIFSGGRAGDYMTQQEKRAANLELLRKSFGDASDSPTIGYYKALPDGVLKTVTDQALKLHNRFMKDGLVAFGSMYAAGGSLVMGFKEAALGFAIVGTGLVVDAVQTHRNQTKLQKEIFAFKAE